MQRPSVALVAAAILIAACSATPSASPATTPATPTQPLPTTTLPPSPFTTPTTTPTQPPPPTAAPSLTTTTWTEVYGLDAAQVSSLIQAPTGLLAAGCRRDEEGDCIKPFFLLSDDALSWEEVPIDAPIDVFVPSLDRVGNRLFALGYGHWGADGGAVILTSTDGHAWQRIESSSFRARSITDVIETSFGLIAIGYEAPIDSDNTSGFVVWPVDADGSFGADRVIPVTDDALYSSAIWTGDELLAWGFRRWEGGPAALLASSDGKAWTTRAKIAAFEDGVVQDMVAGPDGLVAVGSEGRHYPLAPRAWTSPDAGHSWLPAKVPSTDAIIVSLSRDGSRLIAQGREPSDAFQSTMSWVSRNGRTWSPLAAGEVTPDLSDFYAAQRATIGDLICVAGTATVEEASRGSIFCRLRGS